jgi:hypothetical protein
LNCVVTSSGGCASAGGQAQSVTINPTSVGGTATATASHVCYNSSTTVSVSGSTGTIQWQQSADGSTGWATVTGGSGGTTATYTTPNLTATTYYRAVITSGACSAANSTTTSVTVDAAPVGGTATATATHVCTGSGTAVSVSGSTGSIQWQQSADGSTGWATVTGGSGGTTATYTTPNLTATTYYRAQLSSGVCTPVNSTTASVTVDAASVGGTATATLSAVCVNGTTTINLTGNTGSTIQWQQSADGSTGWATVTGGSGGTTATYTTPALTTKTYYRAVVQSGSCASANSSVTSVGITANPSVTGQPANASACQGSTASFTVTATGVNSEQWQYSSNGGSSWSSVTDGTGGTTLTYTTPTLSDTLRSGYKYRCHITGCGGATVDSDGTATLTVNAIPSQTITAPSTVCPNSTGNSASVVDPGSATFAWTITGGTIPGSTTGVSVLFTAGASGTVQLSCVITKAGCSSAGGQAQSVTIVSTGSTSTMPLQQGNGVNGTGGYQGAVDGAAGTGANDQTWAVYALGTSAGEQSIGLLQFKDNNGTGIGTIPSGATVSSATLTLVANANLNGGAGTLYVAPVTSAWVAGNQATPPSFTTGSAVSCGTIPSAGQPINFNITSIVQSWVNGSKANLGVAIYADATGDGVLYDADNQYNGASAPLLTIQYVTPLSQTITAPSSVCANSTGNSASVVDPGSATFAWTITGGTIPGSTTGSSVLFTAGASGTVQLSCVITKAGCSSAGGQAQSVTITAAPAQTITAAGPVCASSAGNTASVSTTAGATYSWSISGGTITAGGTSSTVTYTAGTGASLTLSCVVTSSGGCASAGGQAQSVTINPTSVGGSTSANAATICQGSTSQITLSGQTGSITKWQSSPNNSTWSDIASTANPYTTAALSANTYYRAVVQSGVCSTANSASTLVTVNPTSVGGTATATLSAVCVGASTTIGLAGNTGSTIQWQQSGNGSTGWTTVTGGSGGTTTTYTTPGLTTKTYYRAVVTSGACSSANSSVTSVDITANPAVTGQPANTTVCQGSTASFTVTATGVTSYQWQYSSNSGTTWQNVTDGTGQTSATYITPTLSDTSRSGYKYKCHIVGCGGATTDSDGTSTLTVNAIPSQTITAPSSVCANSTGNMASVPTSSGGSYAWTISGGTITAGQTAATVTFTAGASGSVVLNCVVTSSGGCASAGGQSQSVPITVVAGTPATMTLQYSANGSGYQSEVDGGAGTFSGGGWSGGYEGYIYGTLGSATANQAITLMKFADGNGTGIGTIPSGATVSSATLQLYVDTINGPGTLYAAPITATWTCCANVSLPTVNSSSAVSVAIPGSGSTWVTFDITSIVQSWVNGSTNNNGLAFYCSADYYGAKIQEGNFGYNTTHAPLLTIDYMTGVDQTITAPASVCANSTGNSASVVDPGSATFAWTITGGSIPGSTTGSSVLFTAGASGTVQLNCVITKSGSCPTAGGQAKSVTINALPTASVSGDAAICPSGSANIQAGLTGTGPWNVTWLDGSTNYTQAASSSPATRTVSPSVTTVYTVTVMTDGNGCSAAGSGSATIRVSANPPVTATSDAPFFGGAYQIVVGQTLHLSASGVGGATAYNWSRSGGGFSASGQSVSDTPLSGSYTYTVTVPTSCGTAIGSTPTIMVLATTDGTIPDNWKTAHGYSTSKPWSDTGNNGMTLLQSYLAGVDPTNTVGDYLKIANISVTPAGMVTVDWNSKQDGTTAQRIYDVYSHTGPFSNGVAWTRVLSNVVPQGATSGVEDDVSAANITQRFYRVTIAGHTNDVATPEIVGIHALHLVEGANYISMSILPGTNTLLSVLGTNQLPQGASESAATIVDIWDQTTQSFLVNNARYWLAPDGNGWIQHGNSAPHSGDGALLDPNKGLVITIRTGQGAQTLRIVGYVPTANEIQTVQGANGYTVASSTFPSPIPLNAVTGNTTNDGSGLVAGGFTGGISPSRSDNLVFFNPVAQSFDTRIWFATGDNRWHNADSSVTTRELQPGEAFLIQRSTFTGHSGNLTWTNSVPYTTVPQLQGP